MIHFHTVLIHIVYNFKHFTKCIFASNTFPNIKIDSGTQRRINSYEHKCRFVDDPKNVVESKGIYLKDKLLLTNLENNDAFLNGFLDILFDLANSWLINTKVYSQTENFTETC